MSTIPLVFFLFSFLLFFLSFICHIFIIHSPFSHTYPRLHSLPPTQPQHTAATPLLLSRLHPPAVFLAHPSKHTLPLATSPLHMRTPSGVVGMCRICAADGHHSHHTCLGTGCSLHLFSTTDVPAWLHRPSIFCSKPNTGPHLYVGTIHVPLR